jgi:hypothetical protein
MSSRPPDGPSSRPPIRGRGPGPRRSGYFGTGFVEGLATIARLGLLAITFAGALNALRNVFHGAAVSRRVDAPLGLTYLALTMAAASVALMVALTVNAAFLVDRVFSRRVAGYLVAAVCVLGAGSIGVGFDGGRTLGGVAALSVLMPAVAFVLSMLLVRWQRRRPASSAKPSRHPPSVSRSPAPKAPHRPGRAPRRRQRGGRKR